MKSNFEPLLKNKPVVITTLNGIGDLCWCFVKLANLKKIYDIPKITIKMHMAGDQRDARSQEFIKRFDFIDFIIFSKFEIHKNPVSENNRINYIDNGYNSKKTEYTFIVNPYIEWDGRIEEILPEVPPCFDFFKKSYVPTKADMVYAKNLQQVGYVKNQKNVSCILFHLGCVDNNTHNGMNRFENWNIKNWADLARKLRQISDLPIYVVGAKYDNEYALRLMKEVENENLNIHNMCGKTTTTQVIEIMKHASLVVSFASGIGIASTYLETPTVMFWMPEKHSVSPYDPIHFSNSFATNWVPPYLINKTYYPAYYFKDTVDTVFNECKKIIDQSNY